MSKYLIYRLDFARLYRNNRIVDGYLECNYDAFKSAFYNYVDGLELRNESLLLDQTIKALNGDYNDINYFKDKYVIIDFLNTVKDNLMDRIYNIKNGIKIQFNEGGLPLVFKLFLRTDSMSRHSQLLYINEDIYPLINKRATFELNNSSNINIAKWFSYSGKVLSDCLYINRNSNILKSWTNRIVVIDDLEMGTIYKKCITAISVDSLADELKDIVNDYLSSKDKLERDNRLNNYIKYINDLYAYFYEYVIEFDSIDINKANLINCLFNNNYKPGLSRLGFRKMSIRLVYLMISIINKSFKLSFIELRKNISELLIFINDIYLNECKRSKREIHFEPVTLNDYYNRISMFDGEGLMSLELANEINNRMLELGLIHNPQASIQIRLPFIKGILHKCDFRAFFKEKGISHIKGMLMNGEDRLFNIDDIEIILTKSQFKAYGFINNISKLNGESPFDSYIRLLNEYEYDLGISGIEPLIYSYNGNNMIALNRQVLATIPLNAEFLNKYIIKPNRSLMINELKNDKLIKKLEAKYPLAKCDKTRSFFINTKVFDSFKKNQINSYYVNNILNYHFLVKGSRKIVSGDLLELLYYSAGLLDEFINNKKYLGLNEYYSNSQLGHAIITRNPHYSRNEIVVLKGIDDAERNKYFKDLANTIMINPLSGVSDRLGGMDFDGDTVSLITEPNLAKEVAYRISSLPLIKIPSLKAKSYPYYDNGILSNYAYDTIINTFNSRVGLISNSAISESFNAYFNKLNDNKLNERLALYSIISGIEIDSAKASKKPELISSPKFRSINNTLLKYRGELYLRLKAKIDLVTSESVNEIEYINNNINSIYKKELEEECISPLYYLGGKWNEKYDDIKLDILNEIKEKPSFDLKELNRDHYEGDSNNINFILVSLFLYKNFNRLKHSLIEGVKRNSKSELEADINKILEDNNSNIDNIIFKSNAMDIYLNNSYYYLDNDIDRLIILNKLGIDSNYDLFMDYKNNGQYLLYLMILNNKFKNKDILIPKEFNNKLDPYKKKASINDGLLKNLYNKQAELINQLINRFKTDSNYKLNDLECDTYKIITSLVSNIDLREIISLIGYKAENENYFIDILSNNIIKYVEGL